MKCHNDNCDGEYIQAQCPPIKIRIGRYEVVHDGVQTDVCPKCGYYTLTAKAGSAIEENCALRVMERGGVGPAEGDAIRKVLGIEKGAPAARNLYYLRRELEENLLRYLRPQVHLVTVSTPSESSPSEEPGL